MNNERAYIIKAGNAGLVTTTAGNDLLHTLPIATTAAVTGARSAIITKIMAYNNTGANVTLQFGTLNRAAAPAFVQLLPTLVAINGFDNEWIETEIPAVEFMSWPQLTAAGRLGDIYVLASVAAVLVLIEVKEIG
jgi:hypothetical protein